MAYESLSSIELQQKLEEVRHYESNWNNLFLQGDLDGESPERIKYFKEKEQFYALEASTIERELTLRSHNNKLASA
ncbi:hypothetical protein [Bacillus sp. V5-8f]|uniref:hypothetical protein n=1 Tax=Bacillus sp. V5-8f TaxID=2053044 RepID=UPI000C7736C0|nr:hypothetical protein [Bacillus sp. V5-8f]PLT34510.1 hypothetical protein CUU64_09860 [Bacillus sp. V5-8f]